MNEYEITYLSETHLSEEGRGELDNAIDSQINDLGGSVVHSTPNIRLKLAYPVKKKTAAFTRTIHVELEPNKIDDFHTFLKKNSDIIRFRTITTPYRPGIKTEETASATDKKETTKTKEKPAKKVTMEDVEKGIEEVLEEEVK